MYFQCGYISLNMSFFCLSEMLQYNNITIVSTTSCQCFPLFLQALVCRSGWGRKEVKEGKLRQVLSFMGIRDIMACFEFYYITY